MFGTKLKKKMAIQEQGLTGFEGHNGDEIPQKYMDFLCQEVSLDPHILGNVMHDDAS